LADEYQMIELTKRCRQFLMQQRGTLEILLIAQHYNFDDVVKRCAEHLKHTINTAVLTTDSKIKMVNVETLNQLLIARVKHLESLLETFKKKVCGACEKFRDIKALPGKRCNMKQKFEGLYVNVHNSFLKGIMRI
jgi:hypothetical protein